jgi:hypothetical protein
MAIFAVIASSAQRDEAISATPAAQAKRDQSMSTTVFSAPALEFSVIQEADGLLNWHGLYRGKKVKTALPVEQGAKCILLLDPDACLSGAFDNLFCIDRGGSVVWTAPLPTSRDAFVEMNLGSDGLHAVSWSGYHLLLDAQSGRLLSQVFVK